MKLHPNNKYQVVRRMIRGFTLVEMLLVLVILGTLASIIYPRIADHMRRARIVATRTQLDVFRTALSAFEIDNDRYPKDRNGLQELIERPTDARNWHGPYLEKRIIPKDPWHNEYAYESPGKHNPDSYDIISAGPDGTFGTEDDIGNWESDPE
jgi:general secretion pathway protein G